MGTVEEGNQRLVEEVAEENSLCYIAGQQEWLPFVAKTALAPVFYHGEAFFLHPFMNNPG